MVILGGERLPTVIAIIACARVIWLCETKAEWLLFGVGFVGVVCWGGGGVMGGG